MLSSDMVVHPEEVALACLSAALVVPPAVDSGWGVGFDSQTAQAELALLLLDELLDDDSPRCTSVGELVVLLHKRMGRAGSVLAMSMITTLGNVAIPDDIATIFDSLQSLMVNCGMAPADPTIQCVAGIDPHSPLGMAIRRTCAAFRAAGCDARADIVARLQAAMRGAAEHIATAVDAAAAGSGDPALQDPETLRALAAAGGAAAAAVQRVAESLEAAEEDFGFIGGTSGYDVSAAAATVSCGLPPLRSGDRLAAHLAKRIEEAQARPAGCGVPDTSDPQVRRSWSAAASDAGVAAAAAGGNEKEEDGGLRALRSELPQLRYLELVEAIKARDATAAADALHRYFDVAGAGAAAAAAATAAAGSGGAAAAGGEAAKGRCHSALLSLSAARAELGQVTESKAALQEALRMAQQQGDPWALLHSLAGLCRLLVMTEGVGGVNEAAAEGGGSGGESEAGGLDLAAVQEQQQALDLLRRCLRLACQQQCPHIAAFARVAIARFGIAHASAAPAVAAARRGAGVEPTGAAAAGAVSTDDGAPPCAGSLQAQVALRDACALQHAAAVAAAAPSAAPGAAAAAPTAPGAPPRPRPGELYNPSTVFGPETRGSLRASARACSQAAGAAHLLQAAAWEQYGAAGLAAAHALVHLTCYGGATSSSSGGGGSQDAATAWAQLVALALNQQGPAAADVVLALAARRFTGRLPKPLAVARAAMLQRRATEEGDARTAELWLSELASCADPAPGLDRSVKLDAALAHAAALAAGGALAAAHDAAAAAFSEASRAGMQVAATRALLQLGQLHLAAGDPPGALPYALSASLHCRQLHLATLAPAAALLVARLWHALAPRGGGAAAAMLGAALPLALAQRDLAAVGRLKVAAAELALSELEGAQVRGKAAVAAGDGGDSTSSGGDSLRRVRVAAEQLASGAAALEAAGAWHAARDAWQLLAVLLHARGEGDARDAAAARALGCERAGAAWGGDPKAGGYEYEEGEGLGSEEEGGGGHLTLMPALVV